MYRGLCSLGVHSGEYGRILSQESFRLVGRTEACPGSAVQPRKRCDLGTLQESSGDLPQLRGKRKCPGRWISGECVPAEGPGRHRGERGARRTREVKQGAGGQLGRGGGRYPSGEAALYP